MSEATDQQEEFTDLDYPPPLPRRRMWRVLDTRLGRLTVLAVVLVLIGGGLAWWASLGAARLTSGTALPDSNVMVDTGTDSTSTLSPSAGPLSVPASVTAAMVGKAVHVSWQPGAATDQVAQYLVYRNGVRLAVVTNTTTYQDTTVVVGTKYGYQVQAVNAAGTGSALSAMVSITVPAVAGVGGPPAPPPPLPPMPTGWPSASSTGASGALENVSGDVVLNNQGEVYANKRINGTLTVTACNVTLRNVEVDSGEPFTGNNTPDLFAIWLQESATCGVTVDHVSTITASAPNVYVTTSIRIARGGPVTITNSKLLGAQLGILGVSAGTVRGNFIELGKNMRGDHNDAIQGDGATNLTIDHNTLLNPNDQTSALALYTEYGNNNNIMVSGNLMAGGGYTCYCGDGKSDNNGNPARAVNVSIVNNVFWRKYFTDAGAFGPGRAYNPAGGGRWVGNVYMNADGTVTTQAVPQPAIDQ